MMIVLFFLFAYDTLVSTRIRGGEVVGLKVGTTQDSVGTG